MPKLIIIRGNSGSGKSTTAQELRTRLGGKVALIGQDHFRRVVLGEKDIEGGDNIDLISQTVEFALQRGYHVILEGIFAFSRYGDMLTKLVEEWPDYHAYYFDVPFEETLRRHATRTNAHEFGEAEIRQWWIDCDFTGFPREKIIAAENTVEENVNLIVQDVSIYFLAPTS